MARLADNQVKTVPTGIEHGTITAVLKNRTIEITTLRRDSSCDGRHANVEYTQSWEEDAQRRDFTMNGIFMDGHGELYDYVSGIEDAQAGRVRFIGDAAARIQEDYLRILRLFRFYATHGNTPLDKHYITVCRDLAPALADISGERISQEMRKLLSAGNPYESLVMMQQAELLPHIALAEATINDAVDHSVLGDDWVARLVIINASHSRVASRWKLSKKQTAHIEYGFNCYNNIINQHSDSIIKKYIRRFDANVMDSAIKAACAKAKISQEQAGRYLDIVKNWRAPVLPVTGRDLLTMGYSEGGVLGDVLRQLEEQWESADYKMGKTELLEVAKAMLPAAEATSK